MFSAAQCPITCVLVIFVVGCWSNAQNKNDGAAADPKHISAPEQHKQDRNYELQPGVDPDNRPVMPFLRHVAKDQAHFWTLPGQVRKKDIEWILPVAGGTAALIASDSWLSHQVPNRPGQLNMSKKVSNYSLYSLIGADAAAYSLAAGVTVTRVGAGQHFASDVVIGAGLGWYFGHEVYRAHHDPELGGAAWGDYFEPTYEPKQRDPRNMSSPYVSPDNWTYP